MAARRRLSVLVVDDYPDSAETLAAILRAVGHDVRTARGGEEALSLLNGWQPDAAILDLRMPRLNGFALAERLAQAPRRPLLVAVSGSILKADWERAAALFDHQFVKPADPSELTNLLREYAARVSPSMQPE
jgi:CheY-like chemotaxis protein